jgi:DNA-directed RNA polymerase II subunit RPB1
MFKNLNRGKKIKPEDVDKIGKFEMQNRLPLLKSKQGKNSALIAQPITTNVEIRKKLQQISKQENELQWLNIVGTSISTLSHENTKAMSIMAIVKNVDDRQGVNSPALGPTATNVQCETCGKIDCPGHYSYIDLGSDNNENLQIYIINPILSKILILVLNSICSSCGKLRIDEIVLREKGIFNMAHGVKRLKMIAFEAIKPNQCMSQKNNRSTLPCEINPVYSRGNFKETGKIFYRYPPDKKNAEKNAKDIFNILDNISDSDARILGFNENSHPRDIILRSILVIPPVARPPEFYNNALNQHHLTGTYNQIVSRVHKAHVNTILDTKTIKDIFQEISKLFNKKNENKTGYQNSVSIVKLLQGKDALIRKEVIAKRINQCARTVIIGDVDIPIWYISAPAMWQQKLSRQEKVTFFNREVLSKLLHQGKIYYVIDGRTRERKYRSNKLHIGDTVEVKLEDDAFITFGRQPTLGPESFMGARVVFKKDQLAIGLHLSYSTPLNADFDGDENHFEVPQGVKAEVELRELMMTNRNFLKNGAASPAMGLVMNAVIASYLLSNSEYQIPLYLYSLLAQHIKSNSSEEKQKDFLQRCYDLGLAPLSGKALYSQSFPSDFHYNKKDVLIVNGILLDGRLTKAQLGSTSRSIIHDLVKYYGQDRTAIFMTEIVRLCNNWLIETGFTVGEKDLASYAIEDESGKEVEVNQYIMQQKLAEFYLKVEALYSQKIDKEDILELEHRERLIGEALNELNENAQLLVRDGALNNDNAIVEMTDQRSGMKADLNNIAKITTINGQMYYEGGRIAIDPASNRTLPSFDIDSEEPAAYGFIESGFAKGCTPSGFFFSHLVARLAVSDSASRTPLTGSLERNLIKMGENVIIGENGCILNNRNYLISTTFNMGLAINQTMGNGSAIDISTIVKKHNAKFGWVVKQANIDVNIREKYKNYFSKNNINKVSDYNPPLIKHTLYERLKMVKINPPHYKLSKYEVAAVIGERARMLEEGSMPRVAIDVSDLKYESRSCVGIAYREYEAKLYKEIGLKILRRFPNNYIEIVELTDDRLTAASKHLTMY